jgi:hypothetical protein
MLALTAVLASALSTAAAESRGSAHPNVLVFVLDDIGIDAFSFPPFGWNASPGVPQFPVLAQIAAQGVSFRNFWATPECSPSRAAMLTGRHGFRTGVITAITDPMLPVNQLHPSEITVPKLAREAGYVTGMLGKYHLGGGPENTPPGYGYEAPIRTLGLDFYDGYWDLPPAIDSTVGGQVPAGTYDCGAPGGFDSLGAACFPDGSCVEGIQPFAAMAAGGVPLLRKDGSLAATCDEGDCSAIDFDLGNAYYAWERVVSTPAWSGKIAGLERQYMSTFIGDRSVEWIEQARKTGQPWMAFVTHSASHTPIQTPPPALTGPTPTDLSCSLANPSSRTVFQLMCDSVDRSIGQTLVELDLATVEGGEFRLRDPKETNTLIVVVNDNGSYGYTVYLPFDPANAKQTVYETGVRSGLIIAGPMVAEPGRAVDATVSIVDLFSLLNEACGIDWKSEMPAGRIVDALPMMPYLTDPATEGIREFNFAVYAQGTFVTGEVGPCINGTTVIDSLITSPQLCVDNGGCWAGGADITPYPITNYCDLVSTDPKTAIVPCGGTDYCFLPPEMADQCPEGSVALTPPSLVQYGVRKGPWKIVVNQLPSCLAPNDCEVTLFRLPEPVPPSQPGIEFGDGTQSWDPTVDAMPTEATAAYEELRAELIRLLVSQPRCDADGNLDGVVDGLDIAGLLGEWGSPGFWDVDASGIVDGSDIALVLASWGPCLPPRDPAEQGIPDCLLPTSPVAGLDLKGWTIELRLGVPATPST